MSGRDQALTVQTLGEALEFVCRLFQNVLGPVISKCLEMTYSYDCSTVTILASEGRNVRSC